MQTVKVLYCFNTVLLYLTLYNLHTTQSRRFRQGGKLALANTTQQDKDDEYNWPQQIWHSYTHFYGLNSVLDSRSMY